MTFAREAWPFVAPLLVGSALFLALGWRVASLIAVVIGIGVLFFFRIPTRSFAGDADILLAPGSGRILSIETVFEPLVGDGEFLRIATFLSVFDVHVQRAPADGLVTVSEYRAGRKVAAFRPVAEQINESHLTVFRSADGDSFGVRQLAGLVARRVVGYAHEGQRVRRGELIGLIKFGSRVDLLVPPTYEVLVEPRDKVREGLTPMARARGVR